jgi:succinate dehydrogenase / fumarate reductase iron-sulfur subunit
VAFTRKAVVTSVYLAYRFVRDERETEDAIVRRLGILDDVDGVWRCQTQFSSTTACPKDIPLTDEIKAMSREAVKWDLFYGPVFDTSVSLMSNIRV